jgi:hypothetical protein
MTDTVLDPASPTLPEPPRPVTARARRRAWAEPRVRLWWVIALTLLLAGIILGVSQFRRWRHDSWLMTLPPVTAKITMTDKEAIPHRPVRLGTLMEVEFPFGNGMQKAWLTLTGYTGEARTGEPIPVYVNPDDPTDLTVRNQPLSFWTAITGAIITASLAVLPLTAAVLAWLSVLRIWRTAEVRRARIVGRQQTPLAPRSRSVRCTWEEGDRRIFDVYVPSRAPELAGDAGTLNVLAPQNGRGRALAVAWFE